MVPEQVALADCFVLAETAEPVALESGETAVPLELAESAEQAVPVAPELAEPEVLVALVASLAESAETAEPVAWAEWAVPAALELVAPVVPEPVALADYLVLAETAGLAALAQGRRASPGVPPAIKIRRRVPRGHRLDKHTFIASA